MLRKSGVLASLEMLVCENTKNVLGLDSLKVLMPYIPTVIAASIDDDSLGMAHLAKVPPSIRAFLPFIDTLDCQLG